MANSRPEVMETAVRACSGELHVASLDVAQLCCCADKDADRGTP